MHTQDYNDLTGPELVSTYNDLVVQSKDAGLSGYRPVVRFADKISAVKRCEALAASLRAREDGLKMLDDEPTVTEGDTELPNDDQPVEQQEHTELPNDDQPVAEGDTELPNDEHTEADLIEEAREAPVIPSKKVRKTKAKTAKAKTAKAKTAKAKTAKVKAKVKAKETEAKETEAKETEAKETDGHSGPRIGTKTEIIASLLTRESGCTAAEVLDATGWRAVSMPAMAKACGLELRRVKEAGTPIQYYGH